MSRPNYSFERDQSVDAFANHAKRALIHQIKGAASKPLLAETLMRITRGIKVTDTGNFMFAILSGLNASISDATELIVRKSPPPLPTLAEENDTVLRNSTSHEGRDLSKCIAEATLGAHAEMRPLGMKIEPSISSKLVSATKIEEQSVTESDEEAEEEGHVLKSEKANLKQVSNEAENLVSNTGHPRKRLKVTGTVQKPSVTDESDEESTNCSNTHGSITHPPVRQPFKRRGKKW